MLEDYSNPADEYRNAMKLNDAWEAIKDVGIKVLNTPSRRGYRLCHQGRTQQTEAKEHTMPRRTIDPLVKAERPVKDNQLVDIPLLPAQECCLPGVDHSDERRTCAKVDRASRHLRRSRRRTSARRIYVQPHTLFARPGCSIIVFTAEVPLHCFLASPAVVAASPGRARLSAWSWRLPFTHAIAFLSSADESGARPKLTVVIRRL